MIHKAMEFAAVAHKGQCRKGTKIPYIVHPFEAACILIAAGADEEMVAAALLHDTLEDTDTTPEDIENEFGPRVLRLVQSNSEDKRMSWEERKEHTVRFLKERATREEALLALADKLSNIRSIAHDLEKDGEDVWKRFKRGRDSLNGYYKGLADSLRALADTEAYAEFCALAEQVFG